jgi:hypothetical protein
MAMQLYSNTVPSAWRMKVNNVYTFSEMLKKGENLWIMNAGKKLIEADVLSVTRWKDEGGGGEKELEIKARQERFKSVQKEKNCAVSLPSKNRPPLHQYPSSACFYLRTNCIQCINVIFIAKIESI